MDSSTTAPAPAASRHPEAADLHPAAQVRARRSRRAAELRRTVPEESGRPVICRPWRSVFRGTSSRRSRRSPSSRSCSRGSAASTRSAATATWRQGGARGDRCLSARPSRSIPPCPVAGACSRAFTAWAATGKRPGRGTSPAAAPAARGGHGDRLFSDGDSRRRAAGASYLGAWRSRRSDAAAGPDRHGTQVFDDAEVLLAGSSSLPRTIWRASGIRRCSPERHRYSRRARRWSGCSRSSPRAATTGPSMRYLLVGLGEHERALELYRDAAAGPPRAELHLSIAHSLKTLGCRGRASSLPRAADCRPALAKPTGASRTSRPTASPMRRSARMRAARARRHRRGPLSPVFRARQGARGRGDTRSPSRTTSAATRSSARRAATGRRSSRHRASRSRSAPPRSSPAGARRAAATRSSSSGCPARARH